MQKLKQNKLHAGPYIQLTTNSEHQPQYNLLSFLITFQSSTQTFLSTYYFNDIKRMIRYKPHLYAREMKLVL